MNSVPPAATEGTLLRKVEALDPRKVRRVAAVLLGMLLAAIFLLPQRDLPPPSPARPDTVFLDKIGLVSPDFALDTTRWLHTRGLFEAVVYIDDTPPAGDLQPWTVQSATEWGVGTERQDRGLVLFIFRDARVARVEVGYGLEGVLPDASVRQSLESTLAPMFAEGRYEAGIDAFLTRIYDSLGGDAAAGRLALDNAGKAGGGWGATWQAAWKHGHRLLPAVWQRYLEGSPMERIGILVFGSVPMVILLMAIGVLANTLHLMVVLPGKLRARKARAAAKATEANQRAATPPPRTAKPRRGKPGVPLAQRMAAERQALAAENDWQRQHDPRWFELIFGPVVFLLLAAILLFVVSMAPEWVTRQGMFGGGGVAITWQAPAGG